MTAGRLRASAVRALCDRARREVDEGLLQACSIAVGLEGEVVVAEAYGAATPETPFVVMSPTKTIVDSALWILFGQGALRPEDTVASHIPEFATHGKDRVSVEQVMTHTGGFPMAPLDWPEWKERANRLTAFARWELEFEPGSRYVYHPAAGSWVLAELIERLGGVDYRDFLRSHVLEPLGLAGVRGVSLGEPAPEQRAVRTHRYALPQETLAALPPTFRAEDGTVRVPGGLGTPEGLAAGFPGAGAVATAAGLARLYQAYLHDPGGLWSERVLRDATGRVRLEMSGRWDRPVTRSLSMYVAGEPGRRRGSELDFFGSTVSARAFGHDGQGGSLVWADPASGLSFAFLTDTVTFLPWEHDPRASELSTLAGRLRAEP